MAESEETASLLEGEREQIVKWSQITHVDQWHATVHAMAQERLRSAMNVCCDPKKPESDRLHATGLVAAWSEVLNWPRVWALAYDQMRETDVAEQKAALPESEADDMVGPKAEEQWHEKF